MWLDKLTALDMTPVGWLDLKNSTQTIKIGLVVEEMLFKEIVDRRTTTTTDGGWSESSSRVS